ncbi:MAG: ABC transporter ATP-binding protein [Flavobacteriales bacterium]|nr:ABC transporter ATP-binding protein [Flavobacteriales bacterium]
MQKLFVLLRMVSSFKTSAWLNILFNVLSVVFSFFSVTMMMPFLGLILGTIEMVDQPPEFALNSTYFIDLLRYYISDVIRTSGSKQHALAVVCIWLVTAFLLKNIFRYLAMFFLAAVRSGVVKELRERLYRKVLSLPISFYTEQRKGDLLTRFSNDVQEVEWSILSSLEMIVKDPFTLIVFLGGMIAFSPSLTLVVFVVVPIAGLLIGAMGRSLKRTSVKTQTHLGNVMSTFEETLSGIRIIKAFSAEEKMNNTFSQQNGRFRQLMQRMFRKRDLASPLSELLGVTAISVVVLYGGQMVLKGEMGADVLITYLFLCSQLIAPAKAITTAWYNIQRGSASLDRIQSVLDADEKIAETTNPRELKSFETAIEYRHVRFSYGGDQVLNDIDLQIPKGKTVALVGASGAGKSTLADLLPRFYDIAEGQLLIDDIPVKELKLRDLRGLMGIVTQESILFNDTVFNNITLGVTGASREQVIEAARIAHAHDFIEQLENGYDTMIGERGGRLSGGQKQRISIARAVLKNPPILILDEATSALDTESEKWVQDALLNLMKNRTSIVIAHRLSTIQHADTIVVLDEGRIVEQGNHQELIERNGTYRKLFDLQHFA